jgi:hypothetical protein
VFTPFHKPPYPYLYGRSVDETTTLLLVRTIISTTLAREVAVSKTE